MRVAYLDPPYLGCCGLYDHHHPDGLCWDDLATHRLLLERVTADFADLAAARPAGGGTDRNEGELT